MRHAHLIHLIQQACAYLEENAEALRDAHSFDGHWVIEDPADEHARAAYERDIELVNELREALEELNTCHQTCAGLEQLLRAHRLEGAEIRYQDLAALLTTTGEHA